MRALSHPFKLTRQIPLWTAVFVAAAAVLATTDTPAPVSSYKLQTICFARGDDIYLMDMNRRRVRKVIAGGEPNISPDGERIAFVLGDSRALKTVDTKLGVIKEFTSLQTVKAKAPQWSPDGSKIAFEYKKNLTWRVAILDMSTEQWQDITASYPAGADYFLSSWTTKGQSVVIQDLRSVYEVDVHGKEQQRIDITKLLKGKESISSLSRFSFSADKKYLLFNTALHPDQNAAIYKLDIKSAVLERITAATIDGGEPHWLPNEKEILFRQLTENKAPYIYNISRLSLDKADTPEILVRNASNISYAPR